MVAVRVLVLLALLAAPLAAEAQQTGQLRRIGYFAPPAGPSNIEQAFRQGLREHGWIEGQNIAIEWRFSAGNEQLHRVFAAELVRLNADLIVVGGAGAALAAHEVTKTTPIVMVGVSHAVELGLAKSLGRPGGNVTGMSLMSHDLNGKRLELLRETVTGVSRIALLRRETGGMNDYGLQVTLAAAKALGVQLRVRDIQGPSDYAGAFAAIAREGVQALMFQPHRLFVVERTQIAALAALYRLPSIGHTREFAEAGGLLAYEESLSESARRAAYYVDKILKGAKPADLPIEQPSKFELVINLKTAKAMGLTIPLSVLLRADQVIE